MPSNPEVVAFRSHGMIIHAFFSPQGMLEQYGERSVLKLAALAKYRPKFGRSNREPSSSGTKISPGLLIQHPGDVIVNGKKWQCANEQIRSAATPWVAIYSLGECDRWSHSSPSKKGVIPRGQEFRRIPSARLLSSGRQLWYKLAAIKDTLRCEHI